MKTKTTLLLSALAAVPLCYALRAPEAAVRFAPAEGTSAVKTFETKGEFTLDDMAVTLNGQQAPMMPEMEMTMNTSQRVVVTDEYVAVRPGGTKKLRRRFDDLGSTMSMSMKMEMMGQSQNQDNNVKATSELAGKTVVFTWDEEADDYKVAFEEGDGEAELLEDLIEDMDLRVLLPAGEVKEGDEWEIPVKGLASVLAPGGNLQLMPEESGRDPMGMGNMSGMGSLSDWLGEMLEGKATGTYAGTRKSDGATLGVIKIALDIKGSNDMTEMVQEAMSNADLPPEAGNIEFDHMDIEFAMEGEGELLWDLEANRMHSFEISGPMKLTIDMAMKMSAQGQNLSIEQSMELSGTNSLSASAE